jgi:hypothetical protein
MVPCLAFLNELSYSGDEPRHPAEILPVLLSTLAGIRAIQEIRRDLVIAGNCPISKIVIGDGTHSLASLLAGDLHKDHWRFIRGLDQASPGSSSWDFEKPHSLQDVRFEGQRTFGMLWARVTQSLIISLAVSATWQSNTVTAQLEEMNALGELSSTDITVPNVSNAAHASDHKDIIHDYGRDESASSVVCQNDEFVARIYFFDHNPPHFHICSSSDPSQTVATYAIQTDDILNGRITGRLLRSVREWAERNRPQLMDNWARCRSGQKPFLIEE